MKIKIYPLFKEDCLFKQPNSAYLTINTALERLLNKNCSNKLLNVEIDKNIKESRIGETINITVNKELYYYILYVINNGFFNIISVEYLYYSSIKQLHVLMAGDIKYELQFYGKYR